MKVLLVSLFALHLEEKKSLWIGCEDLFVWTFISLGLKLSLLDMCWQELVWEYAVMTEEHFLLGV